MSVRLTLILAITMLASCTAPVFGADQPLQVFILAGQSNMEGKARLSLLEYQLSQPETRPLFEHLQKDGDWVVRDDVSIKFLQRHGKLTVGFGSRDCIGPELGFGMTIGDQTESPVLLIKTAWGGKSLYRDFRPPSSDLPKAELLEQLLERAQRKNPETTLDEVKQSFGAYYRQMLKEVEDTLTHLSDYFPEYKDQEYELAGFVWFQGWNDMVNADYTNEYAEHMANFIRDVRKDLKSPKLPFVIGQLGVGGVETDPKKQTFKQAQAAAAELAEFQGNVAVVKTDVFWDQAADAVFRKGWRENLAEWNKVGSDRPYHYLGSPKTYLLIGRALAEAMIELRSDSVAFYDPIEKEIEGWTIATDPRLLEEEHSEIASQAFTALANHLQRVKYIVPADRVEQLQRLRIWIELDNAKLSNMQYHPGRGWLIANGHDPRLVKHVHIPQARDLLDRETWAKHPYVVLHELAHAYHDQVLGFDAAQIVAAYDRASDEGIYDEVLLYTGRKVRHYGLSNHKEYFAEATESYLGVNDFYPFVRAELKEHDPRMYEIMQAVWGDVGRD